MTHSYTEIGICPALEWVKAHRSFEMADPDVRLPSPQSQPTTPLPTLGETRVEFKCAIDQCDCSGKVFTEVAEYTGNLAEDLGVVTGNRERPMSEIDTLNPVRVRFTSPA